MSPEEAFAMHGLHDKEHRTRAESRPPNPLGAALLVGEAPPDPVLLGAGASPSPSGRRRRYCSLGKARG